MTAKPCLTRTSRPSRTCTVRFSVMPCWKITTGQPFGGFVFPLFAFGSVASNGMRLFGTRANGVGVQPRSAALNWLLTQKRRQRVRRVAVIRARRGSPV